MLRAASLLRIGKVLEIVELDVSKIGMLKCYCIDTNTLRAFRCCVVKTEAELARWVALAAAGFAQNLKIMRISMNHNAKYCLRTLR